MKMRTSCVLIFASFLPLIIGSSSERNCHQQCDSLVAQLEKKAATEKGFDLTRELGEICNAGSSCNGISQEQMAEIIGRFMTRSSAEVCEETCTSTDKGQRSGSHGVEKGLKIVAKRDVDDDDDDDDDKMENLESGMSCEMCIKMADKFLTPIRLPARKYSSIGVKICEVIQGKMEYGPLCHAVASEAYFPSSTSANRICTAAGYCNRGKDLCTFKNAKSNGSFFDTVSSIFSIASKAVDVWNTPIFLIDESIKCHKPGERPSDFEEIIYNPLNTAECQSSCPKMTKKFTERISRWVDFSDRKKFKDFCSEIIHPKQRRRCYAIYNSTDLKSMTQAIIERHVCPMLGCPVGDSFNCNRCKSRARYFDDKRIKIELRTIAVMRKGLQVTCAKHKDRRCIRFWRSLRNLLTILEIVTRKTLICRGIGIC